MAQPRQRERVAVVDPAMAGVEQLEVHPLVGQPGGSQLVTKSCAPTSRYHSSRVPASSHTARSERNPSAYRGAIRTGEINLGPKCRRHHQVKQIPGWSVTHHPDGCTSWATPSGHLYHSQPPPLTDPEPLTTPPTPDPDEPPPF